MSDRAWPDVAIPPGETLAETIAALGISQAELARRAGRPVQAINEIVRGTKEITAETALQFERVLGVPAHVWVRLDADYRYNKARLEDQGRLKTETPFAEKYPYTEMAKHGWVARTGDRITRVKELLRFFGVASLRQVHQVHGAAPVAFRRSLKLESAHEALAAWLQAGERQARQVQTGPFSAQGLRNAVPQLRSFTRLPPQVFEPKLKKLLADHGVALVLVPHLPKTGAHGATRWLGDKAVLQMSLRYKWDDIFWFTFFHELGHLLLHGRKDVFIELDTDSKDQREQEADNFASERLIPATEYRALVAGTHGVSQAAVLSFAAKIGIAPSIVVGRLQHDGAIPHSHLNGLRSRFEWAGNRQSNG